ncbi:MarR family winged helix-turn-helix transcriptional regulator [Agaribacter flavus]|uniref:MarR family winged helix-turn-helix transcriptional regulator n=1 Tax=Agaribacter flavus TaxID=1902781 RepID=A0ABV7FMR5_9ALTE
MALSQNSELVVQLGDTYNNLSKHIEGQLNMHGISFSEFLVMNQLVSAPKHCLSRVELAKKVSLTASGITRMLVPMEKIGLVEKAANPRDARVSLVKLTTSGHKIYQEAETAVNETSNQLFEKLTSKQGEQLANLLRRMY